MLRPRRQLHGLTEGAIQAALVAILAIAVRYIPLLGTVAFFLAPLPLTVLVIRHGLRPAVLATVVAGLIAAMVAGPLAAVGILVTFAPFGIVVGLGARRRLGAPAIVGLAVAVTTVSLVVDLGLTLALSGINPYQVAIESMQQAQGTATQLYQRLGLNPARLEEQNRQFAAALALMPRLVPFLLLGAGAIIAWLNYQVARAVLRRLGYGLPALPPASSWRIPAFVLFLLPIGSVLTILGNRAAPEASSLSDHVRTALAPGRVYVTATIGLNLVVLAQMAFAFQGLLVAWVLMTRFIRFAFLRVYLLILILTSPLMTLAVLVGIADSVFPLRERFGRPAPPVPAAHGGG